MSIFGSPFGGPLLLPLGRRLAELGDFWRRHTTPTPPTTGWNQTFDPAPELIYTFANHAVTRTDDIDRRAVRGHAAHAGGKRYFEVMVFGARARFIGVVDGTFNTLGAGGPAGVNRVGLQGDELVSDGSAVPFAFATPGTIVRVAANLTTKRVWLRLGGGNWNGNPMSDPVGDVLGLQSAGLAGVAYAGATLRPVIGAGVRYRTPADSGYTLPAGFTEWAA